MADENQQFCPESQLARVLKLLSADNDEAGLAGLGGLIASYPNDPRLHFLRGSVLAGLQRYDEGREAMQQALVIAPGYDLARFQLGFLELTSGLAAAAEQTWAPLEALEEGSAFRLLAAGLNCLARDEFTDADALIRAGMAVNQEHPLINNDMQLLLDEIRVEIVAEKAPQADTAEPASAAHLLLQQFELRDSANKTRH